MHKTTIALMLALLLTARTQADPAMTPTAPKATLAQTLAAAYAPEIGVTLAVGADKTVLPPNAALPPPGASVADGAAAFGLTTQAFGTVTALAPATMTLLNDQPGEPDLSADITPNQAFRELAAALSDDQWKALTSEGGLGLSGLTDDTQRALFWALFPHRTLKIVPARLDGKPPDPAAASDVSPDLPQARLRMGQTATLYPPSRAGGNIFSTIPSDPDGAPPRWAVFHDRQPPRTEEYGVPFRADIPNAPKPGDLAFDQSALRSPIPLTGLTTAGDLVSRIGRATGLELYADPHFERQRLSVLGPAPVAPASDLLRALAFCVTGTFRRVGPAFVLTDDLPGVAAVRQTWSEFQDRANAVRQKSEREVQRALSGRRSVFDIPAFGDPLAPTQAQERPDPDTSMGHFLPQVPRIDDGFPFSALTPSQQEAARRIVARYSAQNPQGTPDLNGTWLVSPRYTLQALLPGFTQPIEMQKLPLELLVFPPDDVFNSLLKPMEKWEKDRAARKKPAKPAPTLTALLRQTPRRAVLADPRSPAEVRSLVKTMQALGLNQLWLYVFEDGAARLPGTPLPQPLLAKDDLLAAALSATQGTGITVFPVMDLLTWGQSPPPAVQDVNVLGETSVEIDAQQKAQAPPDLDDTGPPPGMSVSPFSPEVRADLAALVGTVAARPGLGGLVWRQIEPSGYDVTPDDSQGLDDKLGYTLPTRLAFLRRSHADPLDITESDSSNLDFHLAWDDDEINGRLRDEWRAFRADAVRSLLRALYAGVRSAAPPGPPLRVFVDARRGGDWYGTWDDPRAEPPTYHSASETGDSEPEPDIPEVSQAKSHSALALAQIAVKADAEADDLAAQMDGSLNAGKGKTWDGFVLDIAEGDGGPGVAGLRRLTGLSP